MELIQAKAYLKSSSPYSQSKVITEPKLPRETHDDYEKRTWRHRLHTTKEGQVFIPASAFSNSLKEAAKFLAIPIPGQGKSLYTKNFESAVQVFEPLMLPLSSDEVEGETLHVPSDGRRGGNKRVWKTFPKIDTWEGEITYLVYDPIITQPVFERVLVASGLLIGIGRYRPRNSGVYGRYTVEKLRWETLDL